VPRVSGLTKQRQQPSPLMAVGSRSALLHTGRHYPDDISEDGLIYHYPRTSRPPSRDAAEVEATKNAARLGLPVFVVLPGTTDRTRLVRLGWVEDWDDEAALFLVLFGEAEPTYASPADQDEPFSLTDDTPMRKATVNVRARQQVFRFQVLAQYGAKCAVCSITHPSLIKAAHIRGKREKGSDDWRNGIPLCSTHHDAYDAQLFAIHPDTLSIITVPGVTATAIGLSASSGAETNACGIFPTLCLNVLIEPTLCLNVLKELWRIWGGNRSSYMALFYRSICKPPRPPLRTKEVSAHAQSEDLARKRIRPMLTWYV
jgi:HNH endonuclease